MNVLIVSQYFWPESFRVNDLAVGLMERGHRVSVLTGMPNYPSGRLFPGYGGFTPISDSYQGISIYRAPLVPRGQGQGWMLAANYLSFALSASFVGAWRCRGPFDAIFVYEPSPITVGIPALLIKALTGAPVFFWVQDLWPESLSATGAVRSKWILNIVSRLVRFIYRRCDRILVQSEGFIPCVTAVGADPARVTYFPNWAESLYRVVEVEPRAAERVELPDGFLVMFAGNIGAAQSFETLLGAAQYLRSHERIHWVVLGDGNRKGWLEQEIISRGLKERIHLLGQRPVEVMPRYFALADVLLVTLRKRPIFSLTIPSKVQSYLACGKPIIAALEGEGARIVQEAGAGLTPMPEDPQALAEAIMVMYQMPEEARRAMGLRGRGYFETHFERGLLLERLEEWMNELKGATTLCAS
jgi:glycosyltransferase involved in cell wall biosynthesis